MTSDDIKNIENDLNINLPKHYVDFIQNFKGFQSRDLYLENFIYTDSEYLIQINKLLGFYLTAKFIKKKLFIGENGGGDFYLIDLENPEIEKVYYLDHEESTEKSYNPTTDTWKWDELEFYDNMNDFKNSLLEDFGMKISEI